MILAFQRSRGRATSDRSFGGKGLDHGLRSGGAMKVGDRFRDRSLSAPGIGLV
ncbi:MAG: hypothetical protein HC795_14120 [Coleofasciculaceae cyanobacterium RL_1_1]|nr:hypothetical protein [Coleofasciculaceae cyanobacterium RL_1_1]